MNPAHARLLAAEQRLARSPGREHRPAQWLMKCLIAGGAEHEQYHALLVRGPCGVGKSLGYATPAIVAREGRTIIVTKTIKLQEQLVEKDLPALKEELGIPFTFAIAKGRSHYLCRALARDCAYPEAWNGDRTKAPRELQERWSEVSCDYDQCCELRAREGGCKYALPQAERSAAELDEIPCFVQRARERYLRARVIVTNYPLLAVDMRVGGRILPKPDLIVCDEAHGMARALIDSMARRVGRTRLEYPGRPEILKAGALDRERVGSAISVETDAIMRQIEAIPKDTWFTPNGERVSGYDDCAKVAPGCRPVFDATRWLPLAQQVLDAINARIESLGEAAAARNEELRRASEGVEGCIDDVMAAAWLLGDWIFERTEWTDRRGQRHAAIESRPARVDAMWRDWLNHADDPQQVYTSATIHEELARTDLGLPGAYFLGLSSPFDLASQRELRIEPIVAREADRAGWLRGIAAKLAGVLAEDAGWGGVLVLLTSRADLDALAPAARAVCRAAGRALVTQAEPGWRDRIGERTVLLGLDTCGEGLDCPGRDLEVVIVPKLPFAAPDVHSAYWQRQEPRAHFTRRVLPAMLIKLEQWVGRLIRTKTDRGLVLVLDGRALTKGYAPQAQRVLAGL